VLFSIPFLYVIEVYPFSPFPPEEPRQESKLLSLVRKKTNDSFFQNDTAFDWLYPQHLQLISQKHWTPLAVARQAAQYLAVPGARILDIGCGIGKFCFTAAHEHPYCNYYGVEQRHELLHYAEKSRDYLSLDNASFIHANITQINFAEFDHFYFYNAFYENIDQENAIDDTLEVSASLFEYYSAYLYHILKNRPPGTRIVTYQSYDEVIPSGYHLEDMSFNNLLRLWIKK